MTIIVNEVDVKAGIRFDGYSGPLALAMNRVFDETVGVGLNTWWRKDSPFEEYNLPEDAIDFRKLHNAGKRCCPFMFEVHDE